MDERSREVTQVDAPPSTGRTSRGGVRLLRELIETALIAVLIYAVVRALILPYEVDGASMSPNLHSSDRLLVSRQSYLHVDVDSVFGFLPWVDGSDDQVIYPFGRPDRGDVIVFEPPVTPGSDQPYVKRIVGLPGESVTFEGGDVFVDGVLLDETYISGAITFCGNRDTCDLGPIPDGNVFVLGDNREHSLDSRSFGFVSVDRIIGQAVFTNWPLEDFGPVSGGDFGR